MKTSLKTLVAATAALLASSASAEEFAISENGNEGAPSRAIILSGGENGINREVMAVLYDTSDLHFQDPDAPRFLFIDRQGTTVFGIGGYVEGVLQYDFDGAIDDAGFVTHEIAVPNRADLRNRLGADATHTNLYLQLIRNTPLGILTAYAQSNFSDAKYGMKLKQAYLRLGHVTVGLTRSTFQDAASGVPTIDYQGPSGAVSAKNILVQYRYDFTHSIGAAISAEFPKAGYSTTSGHNEAIDQRFPDIPVYVQYQWAEGRSHVRASAIFRNLSYRNLVTDENRFRAGWGVQLSGIVRATRSASVFYQVAYGQGIGHYINDLSDLNVDLITDSNGGGMKAPGSLGVVGGLRFNINKKTFASASYSFCRLYDQSDLGNDAYRRGNYLVANIFYTPISDMQVGIEYLNGVRTDMDRTRGHANRIEAMVKYSF